MLAKKIISMWILSTMFAAATFAQVMPAPSHFRKSAPRVGKSKGNHRGSKHKMRHKKR